MDVKLTMIEQLVKGEFDGLSVSQKKVAEYLVHHPEECVLLTAKQISQKVSVSETTVIRLSYALGFSSFSEMQRRLREEILNKKSTTSLSPSYVVTELEENNELAHVIEKDILILKQTLQELDFSEIWKAVDKLATADQVFVVGYRSSYAAAYWFSSMLSAVRNHVQLSAFGENDYINLVNLTKKSLAVIISFPRYSRETLNIANEIKKQEVPILAVTDKPLSPVGLISDLTLVTDINVATSVNSMSSVISLLNLVIYGLRTRNQQQFKDRQQRLEQIYTSSDIYIE